MQDKAIIIMEPEEVGSSERACLYLEHSVFGIVSLINMFNMESDLDYQLYLLDDDGGSVTETISSNYKMFKLPMNFSLKRNMYAELYAGDRLVLSGKKSARPSVVNNYYESGEQTFFSATKLDYPVSAKEWASETGQENLYTEAMNVIEKYKNMPTSKTLKDKENYKINDYEDITKSVGIIESSVVDEDTCMQDAEKTLLDTEEEIACKYDFYDIVGEDFEMLFDSGTREEVLEGIFKNSRWSKILAGERYVCLGKVYKTVNFRYCDIPDMLAIAIPTVAEKQSTLSLGKYSTFVKATASNDFGFMVLLQDAKTGKAIKIIKNKG